MDLTVITENEKQQIRQLLDEADKMKGPEELSDWNIRAQTLLVFIATRNPELIFEANR